MMKTIWTFFVLPLWPLKKKHPGRFQDMNANIFFSVFSMLTCMLRNHPCKQLLKVNKTYSMTLLIQKFSIRLFFKPKLELKHKSTSERSSNALPHWCQFDLGFRWGAESGADHWLSIGQRHWNFHYLLLWAAVGVYSVSKCKSNRNIFYKVYNINYFCMWYVRYVIISWTC